MSQLPSRHNLFSCMSESTIYHEHATNLAKDTRRELELLLSQQKLLSRKISRVKRTLNGLCELFSLDAPRVCASPANERLGQPGRRDGILESLVRPIPRTFACFPKGRNKSANVKLERACRVALLESEAAASVPEIYDRIIRRGSYRLNRYKHPLVPIIKALHGLASRNEIEMVAGEASPCWVLRPKLSDSQEDQFTVPFDKAQEQTTWGELPIQGTRNTLQDDRSRPNTGFEPSSSVQVSIQSVDSVSCR